MKKILLSFVGVACALISHAQLILSELYVLPSSGRQEFFELKNTGPVMENADCYSLVTYFREGNTYGFYVVDMPPMMVQAEGYLVASSQSNFSFQSGMIAADFSWNNANINRYVYTGGSLVLNNTGAPFNDIFLKSSGSSNSSNGIYAVFLFKGNTLADAFLGASNTITVPNYITTLGTLTNISSDPCGNFSYNFNTINNNPNDRFGYVTSSAGTDNGYARIGNGCGNNGVWDKTSSPAEHTPGTVNLGNQGNPTPPERIQASVSCIDNTRVSYDITGGSSQAFPVITSLYFDANGNQTLDAGDIFIGSQVDNVVSEPAKTFTHARGQEDFIFVFDGVGSCFDLVLPLNCPAAIILPVTFISFTATKIGSGVSLKWFTASEVNNIGFNVQQKEGSNSWQTIGFVNSQVPGGNSQSSLGYTFMDTRPLHGVVQYRLQQVDIDGHFRYSDIRTIRGDAAAAGKTSIYPNPSKGVANIVFADVSVKHDVMVMDMNGRMLKQWRGITDGTLLLNNLISGVYMIRIIDSKGATVTYDKLVVNNEK